MSVQDKTGISRRGQAIIGALAGVAVIVILVVVYIVIQAADDDKPAAAPTPRGHPAGGAGARRGPAEPGRAGGAGPGAAEAAGGRG
nr:hypothetical protein GCM10020092_047210 [Actinoplanes digitatis]